MSKKRPKYCTVQEFMDEILRWVRKDRKCAKVLAKYPLGFRGIPDDVKDVQITSSLFRIRGEAKYDEEGKAIAIVSLRGYWNESCRANPFESNLMPVYEFKTDRKDKDDLMDMMRLSITIAYYAQGFLESNPDWFD